MWQSEVELLEDDLDLDESSAMTAWELGLTLDLPADDLADEDDLGLRSLYEHPEAILGPPQWPDAA